MYKAMISICKRYCEEIGLTLLLTAFCWQCIENNFQSKKEEAINYILHEKVDYIWDALYDQHVNNEKNINDPNGIYGNYLNYSTTEKSWMHWDAIRKNSKNIQQFLTTSMWIRVVFYILGSILIILARIMNKRSKQQ